jgi:hypothetical protein
MSSDQTIAGSTGEIIGVFSSNDYAEPTDMEFNLELFAASINRARSAVGLHRQ